MPDTPVCALCNGTGWRVLERDGLSGAERCDCSLAGRSERLLAAANIPPLYRNTSFENFNTRPDHPGAHTSLQRAIIAARRFADEFSPFAQHRGLLFVGDAGTGKTHLAVSIVKRLIARGYECVFFDYQNLLDRIRASYDPASGAVQREAYRTALECEVLVLDDLGAHRVTDWVEDTITSIITHRCNHNRALVATTNLRDPQFGDAPIAEGVRGDITGGYYLGTRIGFRARSRLFEMCAVVSTRGVEDYRTAKRPR